MDKDNVVVELKTTVVVLNLRPYQFVVLMPENAYNNLKSLAFLLEEVMVWFVEMKTSQGFRRDGNAANLTDLCLKWITLVSGHIEIEVAILENRAHVHGAALTFGNLHVLRHPCPDKQILQQNFLQIILHNSNLIDIFLLC